METAPNDASARLALFVRSAAMVEELAKCGHVIADGSELAEDNAAYPWERLSDWAWRYILASVDHIGLLASTWSEKPHKIGYVRPRATYTLLRGAMEAAAQAVWVLAPRDPGERCLRHLRLLHHDFSEQRNVQRNLDPAHLPEVNAVERIESLRARSGGIASWSQVKKRLTYLGVIRECANGDNQLDADTLELLWRVSSGFAHGKQWQSLEFGTFTPKGPVDERTVSGRLHPDPEHVAQTAETALQMCLAGQLLYLYRGGQTLPPQFSATAEAFME